MRASHNIQQYSKTFIEINSCNSCCFIQITHKTNLFCESAVVQNKKTKLVRRDRIKKKKQLNKQKQQGNVQHNFIPIPFQKRKKIMIMYHLSNSILASLRRILVEKCTHTNSVVINLILFGSHCNVQVHESDVIMYFYTNMEVKQTIQIAHIHTHTMKEKKAHNFFRH